MTEKRTTEKSTGVLQSELKNAVKLEDFLENNATVLKAKTVSEFLMEMLIKYNLEKSAVVARSGLSGTYAYQIFDGRKAAGREKLLQLAFGFPLTLDETQHLLKYGGFNELYVKNKRDAYVMYAIEKKYDIPTINKLLLESGEKIFE